MLPRLSVYGLLCTHLCMHIMVSGRLHLCDIAAACTLDRGSEWLEGGQPLTKRGLQISTLDMINFSAVQP